MNFEWEKIIRKFFLDQIFYERKLTQLRLNLINLISPKILFNFIIKKTNNNNNFVTSNDILKLFPTFSISDIKKIFYIFDKNNDSNLNLKEFFNFISPKFINIKFEDMFNTEEKEINEEHLKIFSNILNEEIEMFKNLKEIIKKLINSKNFTEFECFKIINNNSDLNLDENLIKKFITKNNLNENIINNNNIKIFNEDVANFIFRFDFDNDFQINYKEFINMIQYFLYENKENNNNFSKNDIKIPENEKIPENHLYFNYTLDEFEINSKGKINNSFDLSSYLKNNTLNQSMNKSFLNNFNNSVSISNQTYNLNKDRKNFISIKEDKKIKKNLLLDLFKLILKNELEIENKKKELCNFNEINLPDLFSLFDYDNKDEINEENIYNFLKNKFNFIPNKNDIKLLFKKYDLDNDKKLNYKEFSQMILPFNYEFAKILINHLPSINFKKFNENSIKIIFDLIVTILKSENEIQNKKIELVSCTNFSYYEFFEIVRNKFNNNFNKFDIKNFLKENGINIINEDLDLLIYNLKLTNKKINLKEFYFNEFIRCIKPNNFEQIY